MDDKNIKNYSRFGNLLIAIGALIAICSIVFFIFDTQNKDKNIQELNSANLKLTELVQLDSIDRIKIGQFLQSYTTSMNNHSISIDSFRYFFTDTISQFFLKENISSKDAYYQMKWYWNKYPKSSVDYDLSSMSFEKYNDGFIIYLPLKNIKRADSVIEIISELRINSSMKIYYIRDFYTENGVN